MINRLPCLVGTNGPKISTPIRSKGPSTGKVKIGALGSADPLRLAQVSQD